jgi:hypothetical protein
MADIQTENYRTRDLAEAAALTVMKRVFINIEKDGHTCWFIFENKARCEQISHQFFFDTLLVNAREYHEALSRLKKRIFT